MDSDETRQRPNWRFIVESVGLAIFAALLGIGVLTDVLGR